MKYSIVLIERTGKEKDEKESCVQEIKERSNVPRNLGCIKDFREYSRLMRKAKLPINTYCKYTKDDNIACR